MRGAPRQARTEATDLLQTLEEVEGNESLKRPTPDFSAAASAVIAELGRSADHGHDDRELSI